MYICKEKWLRALTVGKPVCVSNFIGAGSHKSDLGQKQRQFCVYSYAWDQANADIDSIDFGIQANLMSEFVHGHL